MHETESYCKQTWETKSDISKYWAICVLQLFDNQPGFDAIKFEIDLNLFNQAFSIHDQKVKAKTQTSWEPKELLKWNKKHFSSF